MSWDAVPSSLLADDLRAAIEKVKANPVYEPTSYGPLHPADHDGINDALGRPRGTPITHADVNQLLADAYERADDAGKARLLAASFGIVT